MLLQIIFALMLIITTTYAVVAVDRENPRSEREARAQVDNLRGFALSVNRYISANLDYQGKVNWAGTDGARSLRDSKSTPESLRGINLPPDWYAVVGDGQYTLCVKNLNPNAVAIMSQTFPATIKQDLLPRAANGQAAVVFAPPSDFVAHGGASNAQQWVRKCLS